MSSEDQGFHGSQGDVQDQAQIKGEVKIQTEAQIKLEGEVKIQTEALVGVQAGAEVPKKAEGYAWEHDPSGRAMCRGEWPLAHARNRAASGP
jgi:hypothetical protein